MKTRLVKLEQKHGTFLFKFDSLEELYSICLHILKIRSDDEYYDYPQKPKPLQDFTFLSESTLNSLPGDVVDFYLKKLKDYNFEKSQHHRKIKEYNFLVEALNDGRKAFDFLKYRSSYEYEKFEIIDLDDINSYEG